ncbi:MAG: hypothetical protein ACO3RK_00600 [Luteolibacter sp.]
MKFFHLIFACGIVLSQTAGADPESFENKVAKHLEGASAVADSQDELAADVQQLTIEQTLPELIKLLKEVEKLMDEATDRLANADTGGETIAVQTEIIEKIHAAAKERQCQGGKCEASSAMMDMMERMMGRKPEGEGKAKGKDGKAGENPGTGNSGESGDGNQVDAVAGAGGTEERRVPKASGAREAEIPAEFRKMFDAYNRGAENLVK